MTVASLSPLHPDPAWPDFDLASVPDEEADIPLTEAMKIVKTTRLSDGLPPLFLGCGTFAPFYDGGLDKQTDLPLRIVRLALRYGITAFDTAPSYYPSEVILGKALKALAEEFPRESYQIITKVGKYGPNLADHVLDLEGEMTRKCVERSLRRMHTDYLDTVYIHDVEFNASLIVKEGFHSRALTDPEVAVEYGLAPGQEGKIWGEGDELILANVKTLRQLKKEGKIKRIGISGYPLPVLLRLAILVLHTAPFEPFDMIQSYSQQNLQNTTLADFLPHFKERAQVNIIANASPLNMGLLTPSGAPEWHPARSKPELVRAVQTANELVVERTADLPGGPKNIADVAVSFGMRDLRADTKEALPVVVGVSNLEQVHTAVRSYVAVKQPADDAVDKRLQDLEQDVRKVFADAGYADWSWKSPT